MRGDGIRRRPQGVPRHLRLMGPALSSGGRWGLVVLIYTRVHRVWASVSLLLGSHMTCDMMKLLGRHASRGWDRKRLVAMECGLSRSCVVIYSRKFGRHVRGMDIVIRGVCSENTFEWIVRWLHWLIDRTLQNLPWFQVQGHRIGMGLTL